MSYDASFNVHDVPLRGRKSLVHVVTPNIQFPRAVQPDRRGLLRLMKCRNVIFHEIPDERRMNRRRKLVLMTFTWPSAEANGGGEEPTRCVSRIIGLFAVVALQHNVQRCADCHG